MGAIFTEGGEKSRGIKIHRTKNGPRSSSSRAPAMPFDGKTTNALAHHIMIAASSHYSIPTRGFIVVRLV
jgi:hypothetical protein